MKYFNFSTSYPKLGSSYTPNYVTVSRINNFYKNNINEQNVQLSAIDISNLNISFNSNYLIQLNSVVVNSNNSVTFSGYINKNNFSVGSIDIFPNSNNYTIDYTFNNITGNIIITLNNYSNDQSIIVYINGYTSIASTTHNISYYFSNLV